jgi:hypothetical protein
MDSFSLPNSFHRNMSSIDNDTYMAPDLSHGLDDSASSVSLSPNTPLHSSLLSPGDFSHSSRGFSSTLGGSINESGAYNSNLHDKCQRLEWELLKEKRDNIKLRKVIHVHILQRNN